MVASGRSALSMLLLLLLMLLITVADGMPFARLVQRMSRRPSSTNDGNITNACTYGPHRRRRPPLLSLSFWGYLTSNNNKRRASSSSPSSSSTSTVLSCSSVAEEEENEQHHASQATLEDKPPPEQKKLGESVHLQLDSEAMTTKVVVTEGDDGSEKELKQPIRKRKKTILLSYTDPKTKKTYTGLNISRRRFEAWLQYTLPNSFSSSRNRILKKDAISKQELIHILPKVREDLRNKWKARQLLCDRTELLTVYTSDKQQQDDADSSRKELNNSKNKSPKTKKRGGFGDLLQLYADRFHGILLDEQEEGTDILYHLLSKEYGVEETKLLSAASFQQQGPKEQVRILKHFLEWFRAKFPYYYDRCDACGASYKDEPPPAVVINNDMQDGAVPADEEQRILTNQEEGTFLGYVFPSELELQGKAGRTELYQCHKCHHYTRFPRFNKAHTVWDTQRGRCGEYSMLLYRMLRSVGHIQTARWIVDWADHVWAEIWLNDNKGWVHLDPCEAAVDQPLLYQEWGKQQTYIVGFSTSSPTIQDLTTNYTSEDMEAIEKRRDESPQQFAESIAKTAEKLQTRIANFTATTTT